MPEQPGEGMPRARKKPELELEKENRQLKRIVRRLQKLLLEARDLIDKLKAPPNEYAIFFRPHPNGKINEADVLLYGRLQKVLLVIEDMKVSDLKPGWEVLLGGAHNGCIIGIIKNDWPWGEEVIFRKRLSEDEALVVNDSGSLAQAYLAPELRNIALKEGDRLLNCKGLLLKVLPKLEENSYAVFYRVHPGSKNEVDVLIDHSLVKKIFAIPDMEITELKCGWEVLLGPGGMVVGTTKKFWPWGAEVIFRERLDEDTALVSSSQGQRGQCYLSPELKQAELKEGDLLLDCQGLLIKTLPKTDEKEHFFNIEDISAYTWDRVGGLDKVKETILREIVIFKDPEAYQQIDGTHLNKGIIFDGPPGCGKTLLAKCTVAELARYKGQRCYFVALSGSDLSDKYKGETARKIREVFARVKEKAMEKAKEGAMVAIFIDEIDSLFRRRDLAPDKEPWVAEDVGALNAVLDGVRPLEENVIVLAATNAKALVDPAISRPGRLGVSIYVPRPKKRKDLEAILRVHLKVSTRFAKKYFVDVYEYKDHFGSGKVERVELNSDPEKIRDHFIDMIIKRLLYDGEPKEIILQEEGENEILKIDNKITVEDPITGAIEQVRLKDNLSGAILAGMVETAKKYATRRFVDQKERALNEYPELRQLQQEIEQARGKDPDVFKAKTEELNLKLAELGIRAELKKRDFFRAIDDEMKRLASEDRQVKKRKLGFVSS
jgi:ATP-dependent 26S proteasome regulatory subunit